MNGPEQKLWLELKQADLVEGEFPDNSNNQSPWYVKALLAISGWLAAVFLLGFIGLAFQFVMDNHAVAFIVGLAMIGAAFWVLRLPQNDFVEHMALAASLAGQFLVVWAIYELGNKADALNWSLIAVFQLLLAIVMPHFVHRVFSAFVAAFALSQAAPYLGIAYLYSGGLLFITAWLWLNEFRYPQYMKVLRPIAYGLVLAMVQLKGAAVISGGGVLLWLIGAKNQGMAWGSLWSEMLLAVATLYVVWHLLRQAGYKITHRFSIAVLLCTCVICVASMEAQGITVGLVIILLGFAGGNRLLLGLGIVALLFYISAYYYWLEVTLLAKSQTLLVLGLVLLGARFLNKALLPTSDEKTGSQ